MLRNYFTIALRNILKHKFFSLITILGMTVGVTACLLIILYIKDELSYDRFHDHANRIYQVGLHGKIGGQDIRVANTCPPMVRTLVEEIPEVESATRLARYFGQAVVKLDDKAFIEEHVFFADSNFFSFFSFGLLEGDVKTALTEPNSIVLTEKMVKKYFSSGHALGKVLIIGNENKSYKVTGITPDVPPNSHVYFDFIISTVSDEGLKSNEWLSNFLFTYFKLKENTSVTSVESKFPGLVVKFVGPEIEKFMGVTIKQMKEQGGAYGYYVTPLTAIHLHSTSQGDLEPGGNML